MKYYNYSHILNYLKQKKGRNKNFYRRTKSKTWLRHKDKVVKRNLKTGLIQKQWKGTTLNKIYTVKPVTADEVTLYDVEDVLFDNYGNIISAPSLHLSNWAECEIVKVNEIKDRD